MADMDPSRDDFPSRIADLLEALTTKIRSLTVDKLARVITFVTLGFLALTLVATAMVFLLVGLFRIGGELTRKTCDCTRYMEITYALVAGVFLAVGVFLWSRRTRPASKDDS
jgi:hypothetical protein